MRDGPVRVDWRFVPSTQLGGDSFGYHWIDGDHFAVYLLDVSGHGVGASLLSVSALNVLRSQSLHNTDFRDPAQVLERLNATFKMEQQDNRYFTIWYGVYSKSAPPDLRQRRASARALAGRNRIRRLSSCAVSNRRGRRSVGTSICLSRARCSISMRVPESWSSATASTRSRKPTARTGISTSFSGSWPRPGRMATPWNVSWLTRVSCTGRTFLRMTFPCWNLSSDRRKRGKGGPAPFVRSTLRAVPANGGCPHSPLLPGVIATGHQFFPGEHGHGQLRGNGREATAERHGYRRLARSTRQRRFQDVRGEQMELGM